MYLSGCPSRPWLVFQSALHHGRLSAEGTPSVVNFCNVVVKENNEGNVIVGTDGEPEVKTPNPRVEFPYTYFMAWYVMQCPSLMSAVKSSEDSISFV